MKRKKDDYKDHDCDLCGSSKAAEIAVARKYNDNQPIHVCKTCGFVYVRARRSAERIAQVWSEEIYQHGYTARIPAVKARQTYLAEFIDTTVGLRGKSVCDIGGGEGQFLEIIRGPDYGAKVFAVEPSADNCRLLEKAGIDHHLGEIEDYLVSSASKGRQFDIVTIMWTLENCMSCRDMLDAAYGLLKPGGFLAIATGSRLLVPFKKPLYDYLSKFPADTHCFRFSANTLEGLMAVSGFKMTHVNRYLDTDYLTMIGKKTPKTQKLRWKKDDWREVVDFFKRWHKETRDHYPQA
jgi:2-polyprenyl-3-methyl-5-hydroxy-6-metoxy-1,4-benzoquinol methylase